MDTLLMQRILMKQSWLLKEVELNACTSLRLLHPIGIRNDDKSNQSLLLTDIDSNNRHCEERSNLMYANS
jgi:hypothetical protein